MEPSPPPDERAARLERLCQRLEDLLDEWAARTAVDTEKKDWSQQFAAMALAAQRVVGLRALLRGETLTDPEEESHGDAPSADDALRRHFETLAREVPEDAGAAGR